MSRIYVGDELISTRNADDIVVPSTDDTGGPWNIPYIDGGAAGSLADFSEDLADAVADGLTAAGNAGIGSNVVSVTKTDTFVSSGAGAGDFVPVTGLAVTITPTSAASKILIIGQISRGWETGAGGERLYGSIRLTGGNALDYRGDAEGVRTRVIFGGRLGANLDQTLNSEALLYLDSPNTTSAVTYQIEADAKVIINRVRNDGNNQTAFRGASSLVAIEVSA